MACCGSMVRHSLRLIGFSFLAGALVMYAFQSLFCKRQDCTPLPLRSSAYVNCQHCSGTRVETKVAPGAPEVVLPDQVDFEKQWEVAKAKFMDNNEFWDDWYKKGITSWSGDPKLSPGIFLRRSLRNG